MRYRCHTHAIADAEEYTMPSALISMHPCFVCGQPAAQAYNHRARRRPKVHLSTEKHTYDDLQLRESRQYTLDPLGAFHFRYDFAYTDPASGKLWQYGVDVMSSEPEPPGDTIRVAKSCVARMLRLKCGLDRAIQNQHRLPIYWYVPQRYV